MHEEAPGVDRGSQRLLPRPIAFTKRFGVPCRFLGEGATLVGHMAVLAVLPADRLEKRPGDLLLLTDDGRLPGRIASPTFKLPRTCLGLDERSKIGAEAGH